MSEFLESDEIKQIIIQQHLFIIIDGDIVKMDVEMVDYEQRIILCECYDFNRICDTFLFSFDTVNKNFWVTTTDVYNFKNNI